MQKIIDLTLPIVEHWRYGVTFKTVTSHAGGDPWQKTAYCLESHWFTHIDAPIHHDPDGENLDAFPIEDWCFSRALVLDFSDLADNEGITAEMLAEKNQPYADQHFDILLLRTSRGRDVSWLETAFWDNSQYVTADGAEWIRQYAPKVVGFDFPQDYEIRNIRHLPPGTHISQPCHDIILKEGKILMIEYLTNLWEISQPVVQLVALPLNTKQADGSQIRVIAIENH